MKVVNRYIGMILIAICLVASSKAVAQLKIFRQLPPSELPLSGKYQVEVKQGTGNYRPIFVYQHQSETEKTVTRTENWTSFAFDPKGGEVKIRIVAKDSQSAAAPLQYVNKTYKDVKVSQEGEALILTVNSPKQHHLVRVPGQESTPLMIFTDEAGLNAIPKGANVHTFKAQAKPHVITNEFDRFTVPDDVDVVCIEDGALVMGNIFTSKTRKKPLKVTGHGVIMGNGPVIHGPTGIPFNSVNLTHNEGNIVENVFIIKSRHFGLDIGKKGLIDNVKILGYDTNNDGISAYDNTVVQNCFLKVNDDHIKLYHDNVTVKNCTFYAQWNGAIFQFAWNSITPGSNCVVEDCEVIASEYVSTGDPALNQGGIAHTFISLRESDAGTVSKNNVFRNILVQGNFIRMIGVNGKYGDSRSIGLENISLENVNFLNPIKDKSWIYTGDKHKVSFNFNNVKVNGKCLDESSFKTEGNVILNFNCK